MAEVIELGPDDDHVPTTSWGNTETSDEVPEYKFSYGTDPAITTIITSIRTHEIDVIAINIWTLIRNLISSDVDISNIVEELKSNIENITIDIAAEYINNSHIKNPHLYFYMYNYVSEIPDIYKRISNSKSANLLKEAGREYYRDFIGKQPIKKETIYTVHDNLNLIIDVSQEVKVPYVKVSRMILAMANKHRVFILTHLPLDVHVLSNFKGSVIRSYTGALVSPVEYSEAIFKIRTSFSKKLHVLLGDGEVIKGSLSIKDKKDLYNRAKNARWHLWSGYKLDKELDNLYTLPYRLP